VHDSASMSKCFAGWEKELGTSSSQIRGPCH